MTERPFPHPTDDRLLGLRVVADDPTVVRFTLEPKLCRGDGALFGGTALAAAMACFELAASRPSLWATVQFIGIATQGEELECRVDVVARGNHVDQLQLTATVGERLVFSAVGSTATRRADGIHGQARTMPAVVSPDACDSIPMGPPSESEPAGHHLVSEFREVVPIDGATPGQLVMWARLTGEVETSAAKLAFLADMVPIAICRAAGVQGAGTSLDNSLRVGRLVDTEWVLVELEAHGASGGYGYGISHMWAPDGTLMATGSQSAKLFSFDTFRQRLSARAGGS